MMLKRRLFVEWIADCIEETLQRKDKKGYIPWETLTHQQRYKIFVDEVQEFHDAIARILDPETGDFIDEKWIDPDDIAQIKLEGTDVANTIMMVVGGFEPLIRELVRGRRK